MRVARLMPMLLCLLAAACADHGGSPGPEAATRLHWSVLTADGRFLGSATALGGAGFATNRHVVDAARGAPLVLRRDAETIAVRAARRSGRQDVALLLAVAAVGPGPLLRAGVPAPGEWLAVAGATAGERRAAAGTALARPVAMHRGEEVVAAQLPVAPGFSGGPVVDAEGRLVGIVMAAVARDLAEATNLSALAGGGGLRRVPTLVLSARALEAFLAEPGP